MAWPVEDKKSVAVEAGRGPLLTEAMKKELEEKYFPRYPTRRAALLPALHLVQHQHGWIPPQALAEVGQFLGVPAAEVLDTASFYEEYWLKPKGRYLIAVCRSLSCEICGSKRLTDQVKRKLGIEPGQTTADGKFTLIELECLGSCGTAPAVLINDVLYEDLTAERLGTILDELPEDPHDHADPWINW